MSCTTTSSVMETVYNGFVVPTESNGVKSNCEQLHDACDIFPRVSRSTHVHVSTLDFCHSYSASPLRNIPQQDNENSVRFGGLESVRSEIALSMKLQPTRFASVADN
jgi:hypothetical protein